jgi:hypothetical protein
MDELIYKKENHFVKFVTTTTTEPFVPSKLG